MTWNQIDNENWIIRKGWYMISPGQTLVKFGDAQFQKEVQLHFGRDTVERFCYNNGFLWLEEHKSVSQYVKM